MPGPRVVKKGQKLTVEHPFQVLARLMKYVARYYGVQLVLVLALIIISVLATVQGTLFTRNLIDDYITPMLQQSDPDFGPLAQAIIRVAVFYVCGILATYFYTYTMVFVTQGTLKHLRDELFEHMEMLPISYFDTHTRGDIMSVYTNDIDTLRQMISQSIPQLVNFVFTIVTTVASMFILNVYLTLFALGMIAVMVLFSRRFASRSARFFVAQQMDIGNLDGYVEEMMAGQKVVKVFNHEEKATADFKVINDKLFNSAYNAHKNANTMMPVNYNLGFISFIGAAILGGVLALSGRGGVTLGILASHLTFNRSLSRPISMISTEINSIIMALAGAERVFDLMDARIEENTGKTVLVNVKEDSDELIETDERTMRWAWKTASEDGSDYSLTELKGHVIFNDVDFGYVPEKTVLHSVSLYADPGELIAFVGSTGAGKTTITNLINRFYDINSGGITYDGIDVRDIDKRALRRSLGIVLQETNLFTGTVRDNIRYGKLDATDEEIVEAAKLANADSFIRKLPDGYDTILKGNAASLSQGQRQLLTIARAAVANPPVIILDEATSSIDTRTERIVQEGMARLMKGRTSFVIAHRLSTVRNADCIMVLENGSIIERGTHEQLIEKKGRYYQLYTGNKAEETAVG